MALRQKVWIDKSVQGVLVGRVILYWSFAVLYVGIGSFCFQYNQNPDWTLVKHAQVLFGQVWPWLPSTIFLMPLAIYDVVRLSNQFAGPIFRLRKHFAAMREDIACARLTFREDDYWRDLAAPINDMQAEILRLQAVVLLQKPTNALETANCTIAANTSATEIPAIENLVENIDASSEAPKVVLEKIETSIPIKLTLEPPLETSAVQLGT